MTERQLRDLGLPSIWEFTGDNDHMFGRTWSHGVHDRFARTILRCKQDISDFIERERQFIRDNWPETWPGERTCWSG